MQQVHSLFKTFYIGYFARHCPWFETISILYWLVMEQTSLYLPKYRANSSSPSSCIRVLSTSKKKHCAFRKTWMAFCGWSPFKCVIMLYIWSAEAVSNHWSFSLLKTIVKYNRTVRISIHFVIISNGRKYALCVVSYIAFKRQPTQEQKAKKDNILVKTCIDPVAVKTYEDLKALLETKYPGRFTYTHEIYPLPFWRDVLSLSHLFSIDRKPHVQCYFCALLLDFSSHPNCSIFSVCPF